MKKVLISLLLVFVVSFSLVAQEVNDEKKRDDYTLIAADDPTINSFSDKYNSPFRTNHFYFDPFQVFGGVFQVGYEKDADNVSFTLFVSGILRERSWNNAYRAGLGGEIQVRFHQYNFVKIKKIDPQKATYNHIVYFAPFFKYQNVNDKYTETEWVPDPNNPWGGGNQVIVEHNNLVTSYAGGIIFGMKMILMKKMVLDFYAGGGLKISDVIGDLNAYNGLWSLGYSGVMPKLGFQLGANF
ncbi:MAG: hypothetical protein COC01_01705 [Bacteroidetes bacterium]|nr:hypothetical protein [Bacteroidia bacterium]PCH69350.1 MAG: hypothetical protein COC01_01705 [Bacteroidota bacterium]